MEGGGSSRGRGISPGLVIASLPVSVHVRGQSSSFVRVRLCSCAFVFVRGQSHSFVGGGIRSWVVAFVHGRSGSFLSVHVCLWAVLTLTRCGGGGPLVGGGGGCSSWPFIVSLHGGVVGCRK